MQNRASPKIGPGSGCGFSVVENRMEEQPPANRENANNEWTSSIDVFMLFSPMRLNQHPKI